MATNHPTIHGVAAKAGVSPATVNRVLNAPSLVKSDKRRRILATIEELQFVPKAEAVAKARRQLKRIAVIAPFFTEPSFMERLKGINSVLSDRHYELVIYAVHRGAELEGYIDMLVPGKRVDGLISLCLSLGERILSKLRASSIPLCCVEKDAEGFDLVVINNQEGEVLAAHTLYKLGYRIPGFIGEASTRSYAARSTEERLDENEDELSNKGILAVLDRPDCIFASSDTLAIRTVKCAVQSGISIPDELAVVGFDDIEMAEYVNLTTIDQSWVNREYWLEKQCCNGSKIPPGRFTRASSSSSSVNGDQRDL